jgi:hypothetical protein
MSRIATSLAASLVFVLAAPSFARASDAEDLLSGDMRMVELSPAIAAAATQQPAYPVPAQPADDGALGAQDMTDIAAGEDTTVNAAITNQNLAATNEKNTVSAGGDVNTGGVSLGPNAFTGFAGVGVFVVNTGANSNLQGSIGVSIVPTQ